MISLRNIFRTSGITILLILPVHSCKKSTSAEEDTITTVKDKYIIVMNEAYSVSRITRLIDDTSVAFEIDYEYSDKFVKVYSGGVSFNAYFLNNMGLADSCNNEPYYQYNEDG